MSRIGRQPVPIPAGVTVTVKDGVVTVKGKSATLSQPYHPNMKVDSDGKSVTVTRPDNERQNRQFDDRMGAGRSRIEDR